jgi:hypothetical protein
MDLLKNVVAMLDGILIAILLRTWNKDSLTDQRLDGNDRFISRIVDVQIHLPAAGAHIQSLIAGTLVESPSHSLTPSTLR